MSMAWHGITLVMCPLYECDDAHLGSVVAWNLGNTVGDRGVDGGVGVGVTRATNRGAATGEEEEDDFGLASVARYKSPSDAPCTGLAVISTLSTSSRCGIAQC